MPAPTPSRPPDNTLSGMIERVTFFNEDSGFCVLRVRAKNHREEVTVVGSVPAVNVGGHLKT
jgi:exodeoxyribonuclease V alpha subunit